MQKVDNLVVHCSESTFGDAKTINGWHREKGWKGIGYHWVILNGFWLSGQYDKNKDGLIEGGRTLDNNLWIEQNEVGAHALGFNQNSIGACMIGGAKNSKEYFTIPQYWSTLILASFYKLQNPTIKILGHNETGSPKACPVIDMPLFRGRVSEVLKGTMGYYHMEQDIKSRGM